MSDEYELVSRKELDALKKEVRELKQRPVQPPSADLMQALDRLSGHIQHLTKLFDRADKEIVEEYHSGVHKETDKLDLVIAQNEQLAKGLLHMSDLMLKQVHKQQEPEHEHAKHYPLRQEDPVERFTHPPPQEPLEMPRMPSLKKAPRIAPQPPPEFLKEDVEDAVQESAEPDVFSLEPADVKELSPLPEQRLAPPEPVVTVSDRQQLVGIQPPAPQRPELPRMPTSPITGLAPPPPPDYIPELPQPPSLEEAIEPDYGAEPKQSRRSLMKSFR